MATVQNRRLPQSPATSPSAAASAPTTTGAAAAPGAARNAPPAPLDRAETHRASPREAAEAVTMVNQALRGEVGSEDVDAVLGAIARLPPADSRALLEELVAGPGLAALVENADPYQKASLAQLMARSELLDLAPGQRRDGFLSPPALPERYSLKGDAPEGLRALVDSVNQHSEADYQTRYRDYADRYTTAVGAAKSVADLARIGPPSCATEWEKTVIGTPWSIKAAELSGSMAAGSFYAYARMQATVAGQRFERRDQLDERGRHDSQVERGHAVGVDTPAGGVGVAVDAEGKNAEYSIGAGPVAITVGPDEVETEIGISPGAGPGESAKDEDWLAHGGFAATSRVKKDGSVEGGVKGSAAVLNQSVEAEAGLGARLLTTQDVHDARVGQLGFWDCVALAKSGYPYSKLSEDERSAFKHLGLDENAWRSLGQDQRELRGMMGGGR